jgi:hypothetical protein
MDTPTYKLYLEETIYGYDPYLGRRFEVSPLYVLDELTAYIGGAEVSANINGRKSTSVIQFTSYSLALARAIETHNNEYWRGPDGDKFRSFLQDNLARGISAQAAQTRQTKEQVQQSLSRFLNDETREFTRRTFGNEWSKQNLGF